MSLDGCDEQQAAIKTILNDSKLSKEIKEKFIKKLQNRFSAFENIEKEILNFSLAENKITDTWEEIKKVIESGKAVYENLHIFIKLNIDNLSMQELNHQEVILYVFKNFKVKTEEDLIVLKKIADAIQITISATEIEDDLICATLVGEGVVLASEENLMECVDKVETIIAMFLKNTALIENIKCDAFTREITDLILQSSKTDPIKLALMNALEGIYVPEDKTFEILSEFLVSLDAASYPFIFLKTMFEINSIDKGVKIKLFINYNGKAPKE